MSQPQSTVAPQSAVARITASYEGGAGTIELQRPNRPSRLPLPTRAAFVRTDYQPEAMIYDERHRLLFVSEGGANTVDLINPYTRKVIRSIPVPSARGLDISPDGSRIVVGSDTSFLTFIDVESQKITRIAKLPSYAPCDNCSALAVNFAYPVFTYDGDVIGFTNYGYHAGGLFRWSNQTGTVSAIRAPNTDYYFIAQNPSHIRRSYDGKKLLVTTDSTIPVGLAIFDAMANAFTAGRPTYTAAAWPHPSKYEFAVITGSGIQYLDDKLSIVRSVDLGGSYGKSAVLYSRNGSHVFITDRHTYMVLDSVSGALLGRSPRFPENVFYDDPDLRDYLPKPMAVDEHDLLFSASSGGVALEDPQNYYQNVDPSWQTNYNMSLTPAFGPLNSYSTTTLWQGVTSSSSKNEAWIGTDVAAFGSGSTLIAPPASTPNVADFKLIFENGQFAYFPSAFVYGATILDAQPRFAPAEGGTPITIVGHGLANVSGQVSVTIGSNNAPVVSNRIIDTQPFSTLRAVTVMLPTGTPGTGPFDVTVTTDHGSATLQNAISYTSDYSVYPSVSSVNSILYDRFRNRVYMGATDHVEVFSVTDRVYLAPIALPSATGNRQAQAIVLTPDGTQLLVINKADATMSVIDLLDGSKSQAVGVDIPAGSTNCTPSRIAATNRKTALIILGPSWGCSDSPANLLRVIDLNSLQVSRQIGPINCLNQDGSVFAGSDDGSHVGFGNGDSAGTMCLWESASDSFKQGMFFGGGVTLSYDGSFIESVGHIGDSDLTLLGTLGMPWYFVDYGVQGRRLSHGGSLLYLPRPSAIDIFDTHHAWFVSRLAINSTIPTDNFGSLAFDDKGLIFVLTGTGLGILRHTIPISIARVKPDLSAAAPGDLVTVSGDGFLSGTMITAGNIVVSAAYVDGSTLQFLWPQGATSRELIVTTPDGRSYNY